MFIKFFKAGINAFIATLNLENTTVPSVIYGWMLMNPPIIVVIVACVVLVVPKTSNIVMTVVLILISLNLTSIVVRQANT